ncbi:transcription factor bHLH92 isoform X2 [Punica granatum]|uniref:BHLH domain-containing protein n=2 Tax=Punica granatum TaxID=22663 RepID=A0A218VRN1_PUNGR|nr:transcription factor bHLH92 isoform X2 [Punica granatum]OWM63204.1 hypothetical protein CDL15_Pgr010604 [Punica granatum]PKI65888.1 hypothetical protein CRG98_013708 [Punica granatum]
MDVFFQEDHELFVSSSSNSSLFWSDDIPPAHFPSWSSFMPYRAVGTSSNQSRASLGLSANMNKRVLEFVRRSWPECSRNRELDRGKGYQHMMSERMRREKQKQSFSALHSLLPRGTKNDKKSIVQAALTKIQDLQGYKEELQKRNDDLKASLGVMAVKENDAPRGTKIKVRIGNPVSGMDSMLEVLRCLDDLGLETTSARSKFSAQEFSAVLETREKVEAAEVENVIQSKLYEAERKLLHKLHGIL